MIQNYTPSKTIAEFLGDVSFIRALQGPLGSGKSVGCCIDIGTRAQNQAPDAAGVRKSRWAVIRNTYQQLRDTALKTWLDWYPDGSAGIWRSMESVFKMRFPMSDGTKVEADVLFRALDNPQATRNLLSLELTGGWINEYREVPFEVLMALSGRVGRYPSKADGPGPTWAGILMDTNPPDLDSRYYNLFEKPLDPDDENYQELAKTPMRLWKQPSGMSKEAENLENLPPRYYENMLAMAKREGRDESWIDVHVHGNYGFIMDGRPVYGDVFDRSVHVAKRPLRALEDRPILIGADWGLTPSALLAQVDVEGRWLVLGEYVTEDCAADEFGRLLRADMIQRFGFAPNTIYGDPAGQQRSQVDMRSVFDVLCAQGYKVYAGEQSPQIRIDSVRAAFNRSIRGGPGILIDPSCDMFIRGLQGGYQYRRMKVSGERYADKPEKNKYSHIQDAAQYLFAEFEAPALRGGQRKDWPTEPTYVYGFPEAEQQGDWNVWDV